jgi:hypothetical protein
MKIVGNSDCLMVENWALFGCWTTKGMVDNWAMFGCWMTKGMVGC